MNALHKLCIRQTQCAVVKMVNQLSAVFSQVFIIVIVNSEICFMCIASQRVVHMS